MTTPGIESSGSQEFAAPMGSIFLNPAFKVDDTFLGQVGQREEIYASAREAHAELAAIDTQASREKLSPERAWLMYGPVMSAKQPQPDAATSKLQDRADTAGILRARIVLEADRMADGILQHFSEGEITLGESKYVLARGAWDAVWLTRQDEDAADGNIVFGRYDAIDEAENLRNASLDDQLQLVLDVFHERQKAVDIFGEPETIQERKKLLTARTEEHDRISYPYESHMLHYQSLGFFNAHEDLLHKGFGMVAEFGWDGEHVLPVETSNVETVSIGFDARQYVADQNLRLDDKSKYFDGPGTFSWTVVKSTGDEQVIFGLDMRGALVHPRPVYRCNMEGEQSAVYQLDETGIEGLWGLITSSFESDISKTYVQSLRLAEGADVKLDVTTGQRPPKKPQIANGFPEFVEPVIRPIADLATHDLRQLQAHRFARAWTRLVYSD